MKLIRFSYFGYQFNIKASVIHEHVKNNQEQVKNIYEQHSSIFKKIK